MRTASILQNSDALRQCQFRSPQVKDDDGFSSTMHLLQDAPQDTGLRFQSGYRIIVSHSRRQHDYRGFDAAARTRQCFLSRIEVRTRHLPQ